MAKVALVNIYEANYLGTRLLAAWLRQHNHETHNFLFKDMFWTEQEMPRETHLGYQFVQNARLLLSGWDARPFANEELELLVGALAEYAHHHPCPACDQRAHACGTVVLPGHAHGVPPYTGRRRFCRVAGFSPLCGRSPGFQAVPHGDPACRAACVLYRAHGPPESAGRDARCGFLRRRRLVQAQQKFLRTAEAQGLLVDREFRQTMPDSVDGIPVVSAEDFIQDSPDVTVLIFSQWATRMQRKLVRSWGMKNENILTCTSILEPHQRG